MNVATLPQSNTVLVNLSKQRCEHFLFRVKKQLRLSSDETYNDLSFNENLTSMNYSLSGVQMFLEYLYMLHTIAQQPTTRLFSQEKITAVLP